jgi:glycosyltransferase involved in cell wall biosynthesis
MSDMKMIKVVTDRRADAIHLYIQALLPYMGTSEIGVELVVLRNDIFRNRYLNFVLQILNTIKLILGIRKDDIVLFADPLSLNLLASLFISNKKYAIFYHYDKVPFYYRFFPFLSFQKVLSNLDGLICISSFSLAQLTTLGVSTGKCKVIWGGVDHLVFKPSSARSFQFDYVLSVGSEEPRKNMENLLRAFLILLDEYPELKLVKVGKTSTKNRIATLRYVEELNLVVRTIFLDYVEEEELPALYSGAQLLLFPSLLEGLGMPILEAMATGCPVVTSNRSPMAELVDSELTIANPESPIDIAKVCNLILLDDSHRNAIIEKGLARSNQFTWQSTAQQMFEFVTSKN